MSVLSHIHSDHVNGLNGFLDRNHDVKVFVPQSFPVNFIRQVKAQGPRVKSIDRPKKLLEGIYTTGEINNRIKEQGLVLDVECGIIIITGCAHPGIIEMIQQAKEVVKKDILLVMGGFHLGGKSDSQIEQIISDFKSLQVQYAGPCHCSGDRMRTLFRRAYGQNFVEIGVGSTIRIENGKVRKFTHRRGIK